MVHKINKINSIKKFKIKINMFIKNFCVKIPNPGFYNSDL